MKAHAKIAITFAILGLIGIGVWKFVQPMLAEWRQLDVSDAGEKGLIRIGIDGWVGYFPLCSPEMKRRLHREGYGIQCEDDLADYDQRFQKLKNNEYEFAVATVDSYLLNGERYDYPGPIISVIDESLGGDAIVARKTAVANLEALKSAQNLRVAFTPDSPSHHLIKAVAVHFDIPLFKSKGNFIAADGSEAALELLKDDKADIAVLWEPEVSQAAEDDDFVRLLGTEDTKQLIVDILIASQNVARRNPDMILTLMKSYYQTLKFYRDNPDDFVDDIADKYDIRKTTAERLLGGVAWASLNENAERWYGINTQGFAREALIDTIESAMDILLDNGDFNRNPLTNNDPYLLTNSSFVKQMYELYAQVGTFTSEASDANAVDVVFASLSPNQWSNLQEIGSLKSRNIAFASGTSDLTLEGKTQVDDLVDDLQHYPHFRVEVRGHTGLRGDANANLALSQERADAVLRYIDVTYGLDANRIRAIGFGANKPLTKKPGESDRAYNYRLPRVEIVLVRESI